MLCTCGEKTRVEDTRTSVDERTVTRNRVCPKGHRTMTRERSESSRLNDVLVRRSGDGKLARGPFDLARLVADVQRGVLKRLSEEEVHRVVELAVQDIEDKLPQLAQPLSPAECRTRAPARRAIMDADIRRAVEVRLRSQPTRIAHVLYALSTLGRSDRVGRHGFQSAVDVIEWMDAEGHYADLNTRGRLRARDVPSDFWWPSGRPPMPSLIIKRGVRPRSFGLVQFQQSIAMAMVGRPSAVANSKNVAAWVLWGLAGQDQVLSAQLAVGVMDCLRRVDDIAYLRWAAVAKDLSVTDFRGEAASLIEHPSTRLVFDVQAAPRRPGMNVRGGRPAAGSGADVPWVGL